MALLRLQPGEDVVVRLHDIADESELTAGVIVNGVGSVSEVTVRAATTSNGRHGYTEAVRHVGAWEVTALQGHLGRGVDGGPVHHVHASFVDERGRLVAGHLDSAKVLITLEIAVLLPVGVAWRRSSASEGPAVDGLPVLEPHRCEVRLPVETT
jgi:predicted DNA-binding protein with PD1-like motif